MDALDGSGWQGLISFNLLTHRFLAKEVYVWGVLTAFSLICCWGSQCNLHVSPLMLVTPDLSPYCYRLVHRDFPLNDPLNFSSFTNMQNHQKSNFQPTKSLFFPPLLSQLATSPGCFDSSSILDNLSVKDLCCSRGAFAALLQDHTVVTWGWPATWHVERKTGRFKGPRQSDGA